MLIKKAIGILLLLSIALYGTGITVHAKQTDKSVKDWYEHPEQSKQSKEDKGTPSSSSVESNAVGFSVWDFFRMIFATIFVVALLYFMLRFMNKRNRSYQKANFLENLGGTSLGGNRSIQLVKVGNRVLVVGVGEDIQLLKEIVDEQEYKNLLEEHNKKLDGMLQPADFITRLLQRKKTDFKSKSPFASQFKKQLEEISQSRKKVIENFGQRGGADDE